MAGVFGENLGESRKRERAKARKGVEK